MGGCCCKKQRDGYEVIVDHQERDQDGYSWEQDLLESTIMKSGNVDKAAIIGFPNGVYKAWAPQDFHPEKQGIQDIIQAFQGNTAGLAERGLNVGCGANISVPGKVCENTSIYGNDGQGGGTSAFKSAHSFVVVVFTKDPPTANRLGLEVANRLKENGK